MEWKDWASIGGVIVGGVLVALGLKKVYDWYVDVDPGEVKKPDETVHAQDYTTS
jgi:hypothetical protein